ncbi:hypothetical protein [Shimia sp. Alg240-R146]|uniref:hypothetical protein n=1 Tax=Shimia sp. Alg240-R146 TaxID=2993449 RepID=UPI0022E7F626|nr:hypothetical protein [Shimia sp. Alg240-R146]
MAGVVIVVLIGLIEVGDQGDVGAGSFFLAVIGLLAAFLIMFWSVVSWHRFVLLEEYPTGWLPPFHFDRILSYFGHGLLLGLVAGALMLPIALIITALASAGLGVLTIVVAVPAYIFVAVIMYRLIPILPAAAIGKPLKFRDSLNATKGAAGSIIALIIVLFVVNFLVQMAAGLLSALAPLLGAIALLGATVFLSMVNVSVLTSFYGLYVEGRDID